MARPSRLPERSVIAKTLFKMRLRQVRAGKPGVRQAVRIDGLGEVRMVKVRKPPTAHGRAVNEIKMFVDGKRVSEEFLRERLGEYFPTRR